LGEHVVLEAGILGGRQVGIRIEGRTLMFFDLDIRGPLRTRRNPIPPEQLRFLRGVRPAGPPLRPSSEPITVDRGAFNTGVITVSRQQVALGRGHAHAHAHQTVTVHVAEATLAIEIEGETRIVRRTTTQPARSIKGHRPRTATSVS
jgi:hypothetical protein